MKVNPERIDLVRRRMGYNKTDFADLLKVDRKTLQRIRAGEYDASEGLVSTLVSLSNYPASFFVKGVFDAPDPMGVSFRSLRSLTARPREAALSAAALAFELDDWVRARVDLPKHDIPQFSEDNARDAALALRSKWGIGTRPIANMVNVLEAHGVRVFSLVEETRHLDAYACWRDDEPYVFLNTTKTAEHSRFDAAHELGHLVMHRHAGTSRRDAEHAANAFASEFLMPQADLIAEASRVQGLADLVKAKKRWGVSVAALNYALNRVGVIRDWQYKNNCIEISRAGRDKEPEPIPHETSQVWRKALTILWQQGITLARIANEIAIPEWELSKLLFNIAAPAQAVARSLPNLSLV